MQDFKKLSANQQRKNIALHLIITKTENTLKINTTETIKDESLRKKGVILKNLIALQEKIRRNANVGFVMKKDIMLMT